MGCHAEQPYEHHRQGQPASEPEPIQAAGSRVGDDRLGWLQGRRRILMLKPLLAVLPPRVQLGSVSINRACLLVLVAMDGQPFKSLPALHRAHTTLEISGN